MSEHVKSPLPHDIERFESLAGFHPIRRDVKHEGSKHKTHRPIHMQYSPITDRVRTGRERAVNIFWSLMARGHIKGFSPLTKRQRMHEDFDFRVTTHSDDIIPVKIVRNTKELRRSQEKDEESDVALLVINSERSDESIELRAKDEIERCMDILKLRQIRYNYTLWQSQ